MSPAPASKQTIQEELGPRLSPGRQVAPKDRTREALLKAAREVFATQGFQVARVRDIARRARANVSAVNYHFGSKEGLYQAVLRYEALQILERFPLPPAGGSPEARLEAVVRSLLARFVGEPAVSVLPRLLVREMVLPTPAFDRMVEEFTRPQFEQVQALVRELLGPGAEPERVRLATFSLISQCFFYLFAHPLVERLAPDAYDAPQAIETLARHITRFSLAALKALRRDGGKEA